MEAIKMDVLNIGDSSTVLMGHYQSQSQPPSFFTVNLTYIDLLKQMTNSRNLLNEKYCDIDGRSKRQLECVLDR